MADIMIDMASRPYKRYRINVCHYCNHDKYPTGKPIMPDDKDAHKTPKGDWMCGVCTIEGLYKMNKTRD